MIVIRRTKEDAADTRRLIISSALKVFSRKGYSATTLNDVAMEAGVTRGAIYWNFENKAELYKVMLLTYINMGYERIMPRDSLDRSPIDTLRKLMFNRIAILLKDKEMREIIEIARYKTEVKTEMNELLEVQLEFDKRMKGELTKLIEDAIKYKQIKKDINPEVIVIGIISYLNGIEDTWLLNPGLFSLDTYLKDLIELFIQSIKTK